MTANEIKIEARLRDIEERLEALQLVIAFALAKIPGDDAVKFLALQAGELDGLPRFQTVTAVLDELRESVSSLRDGTSCEPVVRQ